MTLDQIVQLEQRTREYFKTMKLQDSVVDKLFQIPSGAIRMLSDDKLSPLRTGASNLEEYITQKCKDPNRKAYLDCRTREIDDELIKHAKEYLRLYGNPSEAFIKIPVASGSPVDSTIPTPSLTPTPTLKKSGATGQIAGVMPPHDLGAEGSKDEPGKEDCQQLAGDNVIVDVRYGDIDGGLKDANDKDGGLNVHAGPGFSFSVTGTVPYSATDVVNHDCEVKEGREWCLITTPSVSGWAVARYLAR